MRSPGSCATRAPFASLVLVALLCVPHAALAQAGLQPVVAPRLGAGRADRPDTTGVLTLDAVYRHLAAASPRLAAARADAVAATARIGPAGTFPDPRVQVGFMSRELPGLSPMETLGMDQLQVMQMVPLPGKLALAGRAASARADAASTRAIARAWDLRRDAAMAFYDLWAASRQAAVAEETRDLLRQAAGAAEAMYRVGGGRQVDVLRAQMEVTRMTEDLVRMRAMRGTMAARLSAMLDLPLAADTLQPRIPRLDGVLVAGAAPATADSLVRLAVAGRPMIAAGRQDLAAATDVEQLARRDRWPDLEVGIQVARRPASAAPPAMAGSTARADWMASFMIGASVPLFAGRRQERMREEAAAMRDGAAADVRAMEAETRGQVTEAMADLRRSREVRSLYAGALLPQALATRDAAAAAYRSGGVDFMTLLDTHMTVNRIRQELYALRAAEGKAIAELEMLSGRSLANPAALLPIEEELP